MQSFLPKQPGESQVGLPEATDGRAAPRTSRRSLFRAYFLRKLRDLLLTLLLLSLFVFLIFYVLPGDPVAIMLGTDAPAEKRAALEAALHLDEAPLSRYIHSLTGLFSAADPSRSIRFQEPVRSLMLPRLGLTLRLTAYAFCWMLLLSLPLALLSYWRQGGWLDLGIASLAHLLMTIPAFFLSMLLVLIFGLLLHTVHPGQFTPLQEGFLPHMASLTLPALALALPKLAQLTLFLRNALVSQSQEEYVRTAIARGASRSRILFVHLLRNSLLLFITSLGLNLSEMLTGSLIVEQVFVLPGAGRLLFAAIAARDLPLAQGVILSLAALVVGIGFAVDLLALWIDPRLAAEEAREEADE